MAWASPATAQEACGANDRPWVGLSFNWDSSFRSFEQTVLEDLRAGFRGREIDVCRSSAGPEHDPVASVTLSHQAQTTAVVSVEIRDTLTRKRVARDVDLSQVPADGRAFAVALATDELVWASWAELALERSVEEKRTPPPEVERAVKRDLPKPPPERPAPRLGPRAAFEWFSGGQRHIGPDMTLLFELSPHFQLDVGAGLRQGLDVDSDRGKIQSSAISVSSALRLVWFRTQSLQLGIPTGVRFGWVNLQGKPNDDATGAEFTGALLSVRSGLDADWHVAGPLWLDAGITLGAAVRSVEATDGGDRATGTSGVELGALLGVGLEL